MHPGERLFLEQRIDDVLRNCYDPEIPVNIHDLGLIYEINVDDDARVFVKMTLTTRDCPVAGSLPGEVEQKLADVDGRVEVPCGTCLGSPLASQPHQRTGQTSTGSDRPRIGLSD